MADSTYIKISKIEYAGKEDVYNMEVKDHHNYSICGGFIIHNCIDALRYGLNKYIKGTPTPTVRAKTEVGVNPIKANRQSYFGR